MMVGLLTPVSYAHAWSLSDFLGWTGNKAGAAPLRAEPQNSQNMAFLEAATNVNPSPARGGGDITVLDDSALLPDSGPSGTIADIESNDYPGKISLYVVRSGDTLPQIAKMFDVSVNTILWANDLEKGAKLRNGQTLVILPINGVQHTVKKGDTVQSIAKKYKGDVDEIIAFNDIGADRQLSVGEVIVIPDGEEVVTSATPTKATSVKRSSVPSYAGYYANPLPAGHKTQGIHGNNGIDLGAPIGTPIYAAAEGTVIVSKFRTLSNPWFGGYGNYVIIEHPNGTQTLYGHMSAVYVAVGAHVDKSQPIGEVGNTGKSTGPHLHFEVRGAKNPF
jgi:LysM repeat protein